MICERAALSGQAPMLIDEGGTRVTFGQFRERVEDMAARLSAIGVKAGTAVSWQLPTTVETVVTSAALSRLGAVQNPIIA